MIQKLSISFLLFHTISATVSPGLRSRILNETPLGGDEDSHGCIPSAGYTWCEPLQECIQSWVTDCEPIVGDDKDSHGCIPSAGYSWCEPLQECIRPWETDCEQTVGGDTDSHGCIGSAGYTWCESLEECIRPWEKSCNDCKSLII